MKQKSFKKSIEEKLKILLIASFFFFFLFMLIGGEEEFRISILNLFLSLIFLSVSLYYFRNSFQKLGLSRKNISKGIVFGVLAFSLIFLFTIFVNFFLELFGIKASTGVEEVLLQNIILLLSAIIVSPISEEFFFRGFLIDFLNKHLNNVNLSILLSSLLFAVFHSGYGSLLEIFGAFVGGIILGFSYKKSKTLFAPIFAHFLSNFLTISLLILNF